MHDYHLLIHLHHNHSIKTPNSLPSKTSRPSEPTAYIPHTLFQALPSHKPRSTARQNALFNSKGKDYRLGPVRIDWVDFDLTASRRMKAKEREDSKLESKGPATASFIQHTSKNKSGSTNLPEGTVHIFRDSTLNPAPVGDSNGRPGTSTSLENDGVTLAVLAVPSWMTPSDFLAFVAPAVEGMSHLRMIRDSAPNRSIVVIKFPDANDANEFAEAYNGKAFNSMEPEICHVVRVLSVEIDSSDTVSQAIARLGSATGQGQGSIYELPTCPVCLERMDAAVTGLITVPCSHTFHCMCLSKWGDSRCPVCRYSQNLLSSRPASSRPIPFSGPALSTCASCSSTTNLWICLICGNIGCGRYGRAHAHAHYTATTHLYALELETQRVWDYAGDGYVHRLIQNKADGKLVELPSSAMTSGSGGGLGPSDADRIDAEKIEAIGIEYSYLLTSQLDSQREYYEGMTSDLKRRVEELTGTVHRLERDAELARAERRDEEARRRKEKDERVTELERDRAQAQKRAERFGEVSKRLERELREERAVSEGLMRNLELAKERCGEAERERKQVEERVRELEEQVRDVMIFLEARDKIEREAGEGGLIGEAAGGSVELRPKSGTMNGGGTGKKKKGKKG